MATRPNFSLFWRFGETLAKRDGGFFCHYCWIPLAKEEQRDRGIGKGTVDHKQALHAGGSNKLENLVLCCSRCNQEKDKKDYQTFFNFTRKRRHRRQAKRGIYLGAK